MFPQTQKCTCEKGKRIVESKRLLFGRSSLFDLYLLVDCSFWDNSEEAHLPLRPTFRVYDRNPAPSPFGRNQLVHKSLCSDKTIS